MGPDNIYRDLIDAIKQYSEVNRGIFAESKYANEKATEYIKLANRNLDFLERQFEKQSVRLDMLFAKLCAVNDK